MRIGSLLLLALAAATGACWPFGRKSEPTAAPVLASSPRTIDSLWRAGQQAYNSGEWGDARKVFTRLSGIMPVGDRRQTRLLFFQAELELAQGNELDAVRLFRRVADETPEDSLAPDALARAGDAYAQLWRRPELDPTYGLTALSVFREVGARYEGTDAAKRAEARVVELNERFAYKEYRTALFYYKYKAYDSAILTLRALIAEYPRAEVVPDALEKLVLSYRALRYEEDVQDTCDYIRQFHSEPDGPLRLCPANADTVGGR
jgi:outer membrane protein assembly factor BamD